MYYGSFNIFLKHILIYLHYFQEKNAEFDRSASVLDALGSWITKTNDNITAIEGDITSLEVSSSTLTG